MLGCRWPPREFPLLFEGEYDKRCLIGPRLHLFSRDSGKDAVRGPPKLPEGRRPKGSFGGPRTASFPESRGKRWSLNIIYWFCRFPYYIIEI